jgi:hypothetical protein
MDPRCGLTANGIAEEISEALPQSFLFATFLASMMNLRGRQRRIKK